MKATELASIVLRCLCFYWVSQILIIGITSWAKIYSTPEESYGYLFLLFGLPLVIYFCIWFFSPWIAKKIIASTDIDIVVENKPLTVEGAQTMIAIAIGFFFMGEAINPFVSALFQVSSYGALTETAIFKLLECLLNALLACVLIFTPRGIMRLIIKMRRE